MGFPYKLLLSLPGSQSLYSAAKRWILTSFIFNWISNINLLSFRGLYVSFLTLNFLGVTLEALLGCYIIHWTNPHVRPIKSYKTRMNILWKIHSPFLFISCHATSILIPTITLKRSFEHKISVSNKLYNIIINIIHQHPLSFLNTLIRHYFSNV